VKSPRAEVLPGKELLKMIQRRQTANDPTTLAVKLDGWHSRARDAWRRLRRLFAAAQSKPAAIVQTRS
jgi:hypothetical protein